MEAKKEGESENFDYESLWNKTLAKKEEKIINDLPRGYPRTGITGHYIKKKGHVGRVQLKRSYGSYFKTNSGKDMIE